MQETQLGATGRTVSIAGLGCGGSSRLGLKRGLSEAECARLVRSAFDLGVTFIDTAEAYGTEDIVGRALKGVSRDAITISSKTRYRSLMGVFSPSKIVANLDASLRRLGVEQIDVYHVHAVRPADYAVVMDEIVPVLIDEKAAGKIGHIGITETPPNDPRQVMMARAVHDPVWEVAMVAFHLMNHTPRRTVFATTRENGIGTLIMFAVRNIFSRPARLHDAMQELAARGLISSEFAQRENPLAFLVDAAGASSLTELAYRFARHEPGADVVLFGTGSPEHLRDNIAAINAGPLPPAVRDDIHTLFGHLTGVGFDLPDHLRRRS